jgi:hypothetical protein
MSYESTVPLKIKIISITFTLKDILPQKYVLFGTELFQSFFASVDQESRPTVRM